MTETYVRRLFDQYAGRYDTALTEHLAYRGPAILREAVEAVIEPRPGVHFASVLDLGCGTGLGGAAFRPFVDRLVGVDLSPAMIAKARGKGLYDRLDRADIDDFLADEIARRALSSRHCRRCFCLCQRSCADRCGASRVLTRRMACWLSPSRPMPALA